MIADAITNEAQTYDVTLQWNDSDFNEFSARVLSGAAINSSDEPEQEGRRTKTAAVWRRRQF